MFKIFLIIIFNIIFLACPQPTSLEIVDVYPNGFEVGDKIYFKGAANVSWEVKGSSKYDVLAKINDAIPITLKENFIKFDKEGTYSLEVLIFDKLSNALGAFSKTIIIDNTPPTIKAINYTKEIVWSLMTEDYEDTLQEGMTNIFSDELSGINYNSIKTEWKELPLPTKKESQTELFRVLSIEDNVGNITEQEFKITVIDNENYPTSIDINEKTIFKTTQLTVNFGTSTPDNKNVKFTENNVDGFSVTANGLFTPKQEGTYDVTVASVSAPDIKAIVKITVDFDYRFYGETEFELVKKTSFLRTTIPEGWTKTNGTCTYSETNGLTIECVVAKSNEIKLTTPTSSIGDFDFVEIKFKHTASSTYKANMYLHNSTAGGYRIIYREFKLGVSSAWGPDVLDQSPNYRGGDWVIAGAWNKSNAQSATLWNHNYLLGDFNNDKSIYNNGTGDFMFGLVHDTDDSNAIFNVEYIAFYKSK